MGEGLHQRVVADLAHDEVAELAPVGLFRVEMEAVLASVFLGGVEVPEVPVAALDGFLLLVAHFHCFGFIRCSQPLALRAAHTDLDAVVAHFIDFDFSGVRGLTADCRGVAYEQVQWTCEPSPEKYPFLGLRRRESDGPW